MSRDKIKTRAELAELCRQWRGKGMVIGFTSGSFDIFHAGHVDYLEEARSKCDVLIVGLNSDASIRQYKGKDRPVISQDERVRIVAGAETVDYVFVFDEPRNNTNIETLKPHLYIKAGDYSKDKLTSLPILEANGGKAVLIPVKYPISSTQIIERIRGDDATRIERDRSVHFRIEHGKPRPAVFLDRDGTINVDVEYLHETEKFELLPNAAKGLKKMQEMGYRLIIVTMQAGIGLGYFTHEDFYRVNRRMFRLFKKEGILIDKIYYCPHSLTEKCDCRKPSTKLVDRAHEEMNVDLANSFMIGDKTADIKAGEDAGMRTILVKTGDAGKDGEYDVRPDFTAEGLLEAAMWINGQEG
jgi:D-glycero-D-manno-heptose 1,7-bisphosphate phosphatase